MIIYRPHKQLLCDALAEAKEFESIDDMKEFISKNWTEAYEKFGISNALNPTDIVIDMDEAGYNDKRCGWKDTRYICVKRLGNKVYDYPQCIGMFATDYTSKH